MKEKDKKETGKEIEMGELGIKVMIIRAEKERGWRRKMSKKREMKEGG